MKKGNRKLTLNRETVKDVVGAAWHRTTFRCHQTHPIYYTCGCTAFESICWYTCQTCAYC